MHPNQQRANYPKRKSAQGATLLQPFRVMKIKNY